MSLNNGLEEVMEESNREIQKLLKYLDYGFPVVAELNFIPEISFKESDYDFSVPEISFDAKDYDFSLPEINGQMSFFGGEDD